MELFSPGKINLTLDVGKKREDGYHEVETVMQTFDFGDSQIGRASCRERV